MARKKTSRRQQESALDVKAEGNLARKGFVLSKKAFSSESFRSKSILDVNHSFYVKNHTQVFTHYRSAVCIAKQVFLLSLDRIASQKSPTWCPQCQESPFNQTLCALFGSDQHQGILGFTVIVHSGKYLHDILLLLNNSFSHKETTKETVQCRGPTSAISLTGLSDDVKEAGLSWQKVFRSIELQWNFPDCLCCSNPSAGDVLCLSIRQWDKTCLFSPVQRCRRSKSRQNCIGWQNNLRQVFSASNFTQRLQGSRRTQELMTVQWSYLKVSEGPSCFIWKVLLTKEFLSSLVLVHTCRTRLCYAFHPRLCVRGRKTATCTCSWRRSNLSHKSNFLRRTHTFSTSTTSPLG